AGLHARRPAAVEGRAPEISPARVVALRVQKLSLPATVPATLRGMKRFFLLIVLSAAAAAGIWYAMRTGGLRTSSANVTALLPKETTAFVHVPDVNGTRA